MTTQLNAESIQRFMKGQVSAWNAHDREAFLDCYRQIAPESLVIEYAGRTDTRDGWFILEEMFDKHTMMNNDLNYAEIQVYYNQLFKISERYMWRWPRWSSTTTPVPTRNRRRC